VPQNYNFAYHI